MVNRTNAAREYEDGDIIGTSWASREVVLMLAGRFSNHIFELDPKIWYGHSLGHFLCMENHVIKKAVF